MLKVKGGVLPKNLVIAAAAANAASEMAVTATITSGSDGQHMKGSRHYTYDALDFRRRGWGRETVDIFVNNRVVARGEVVVVDDKFGVRITEIVSA